MGRVLGVDYGDRWIGLAVSDGSWTLARPHSVVAGEKGLFEALGRLIEDEEVARIVLGLPLNMDGTEGPRARLVLAFKERLQARSGRPVVSWDERLSTVEAEDILRQTGLSAQKRRERVDKVAAQVILQSYLDHLRREARAARPMPDGPSRARLGGTDTRRDEESS